MRISADVEEAQSAYLDALRRGERPMSTAEIVASTVAKVGHGRISTPWGEIIPRLASELKAFKPEQIAIVASGRMTNEEAFLLSEVRKALGNKELGQLQLIVAESDSRAGGIKELRPTQLRMARQRPIVAELQRNDGVEIPQTDSR